MISQTFALCLLTATVQAMSIRQTNETVTVGTPYVENAAFVCSNSNEAQCAELQFCEWKDYSVNPDCFENEDLVERINDIVCAPLTEATCSTNPRCEWDDNFCQGQHGAISVVKDANGTITLDTTGVTLPPAGSIYMEVDAFCLTIPDKTTCDANQYCDYDDDLFGDNECEGDEDSVEAANEAICAPLLQTACLADLRCEFDDGKCEGGDNIVIVPTPAVTTPPPASNITMPETSTSATVAPPAVTTSAAVTPGTPTLVVPEVVCEGFTNQTDCNAVIFCEFDDNRCEADEDTVQLINDASCVNFTTEATCETNTFCEWDDNVCEGSDDAISVVPNADGTLTTEMTGVTVPATGSYQNAGKYCGMTYTDEVTCGGDKYCKWYTGIFGGEDKCEADESLIEAENTPICAAKTTAALCAADLRCDWDDVCEATDDMIVVV